MKRGDIYFVSLEPTFGHEQKGHRPVLVLTNERFNHATRLPIVAAITNGGDFAIRNDFAVFLEGSGLRTTGIVRCDQVRAIDLDARNARYVETAPMFVCNEVITRLTSILNKDII